MRELRFAAASVVILGILGAQAIASFGIRFGPIERDPYLWPFLGYPMYSIPRYPGDQLPEHRVVGILPDSSEVAVTPESLGTGFWIFRRGLVFSLLTEDLEEIAPFADLYEARHGRRPVGFRLEDHPLILTKDGTRPGPPVVLKTVWLNRGNP